MTVLTKPKLIIFDLDGTLIEFHHDYLFAQAERIIDELSHPPVTRDVLEHHFSHFDFFRFVEDASRDAFTEAFWGIFDWNNFPAPKPITGTLEALNELTTNEIQASIVTSRFMPSETLRASLNPTGLLEYISDLMTRPGDHIHWSDKRSMIVEMCERMQVAPAETMMVGDIPTDITSAKDVGIGSTVAVLSGGVRKDVLEKAEPDSVLERISEISKLLFGD